MKIKDLDFFDLQQVFMFNNARRQVILDFAHQKPTVYEQLKFVVDYFFNNLSIEETAMLDGVSTENVMPFIYDYSYAEDFQTYARDQLGREYQPGAFCCSLPMAINDDRNRHLNIFPSLYTAKMGTCIMFAHELARIGLDLGFECEIVESIEPFYDNFNGLNTNKEPVHTDQITKMRHFYNIITLDGKKYKIDVAGGLSAMQFNVNHPDMPIDINKFYFSEDLISKPFAGITIPAPVSQKSQS